VHPTITAFPAPTSRPAVVASLPVARPVAALPAGSETPAANAAAGGPAKPAITDAAQLWPALIRELVTRPWMSWTEALELRDWSGSLVKVGAKAGRLDVLKTISPQRREQLAAVLAKITGRPIQVELIMPPPPSAGSTGDSSVPPGSPDTGQGGRVTSKQQAMNLPLVKQVMEVFNATLVEFRVMEDESKAAPAAEKPVEDDLPLLPPAPRSEPPMVIEEESENSDE
jgi:hypothetical protein